MKNYFKLYYLFLVIASVLIINSCKTEEIDPEKENPGVEEKHNLLLERFEFKVGELAFIKSTRLFDTSVYFGKIGDEEVTFQRVNNDSSLMFVVPGPTAGQQTIEFDGLNTNSVLSLNIVKNEISQPEDIISVFNQNTNEAIKMLRDKQANGDNIITADIQAIEAMQNEFTNLYAQLSEEEKKELAQILVANNIYEFELNSNEVTDSFMFKKNDEYPSIQWSKIGATLLVDGAAISALSYGFAGLVAAPDPTLLTKLAAVGAGIVLASKMIDFLNDMEKLSAFRGIISKIKNLYGKKEITLYADQEYYFTARNEYRTISKDDLNIDNSVVRNVAVTIDKINGQWISFKQRIEKIKNWFTGTAPSYSKETVNIDEASESASFNGKPSYYSIENITNNVYLNLTTKNEQLVLTTTEDREKRFQFDLVFTAVEQGITVRKTIDAKVLSSCSDGIAPQISLISQKPCNINSNYKVSITFSYFDPNGNELGSGWRAVEGSAYSYSSPTLVSGEPADGVYSYRTYSQLCCCSAEEYEEVETFFVRNTCGTKSNVVSFKMIPE